MKYGVFSKAPQPFLFFVFFSFVPPAWGDLKSARKGLYLDPSPIIPTKPPKFEVQTHGRIMCPLLVSITGRV